VFNLGHFPGQIDVEWSLGNIWGLSRREVVISVHQLTSSALFGLILLVLQTTLHAKTSYQRGSADYFKVAHVQLVDDPAFVTRLHAESTAFKFMNRNAVVEQEEQGAVTPSVPTGVV
jgi:hypothetical protein